MQKAIIGEKNGKKEILGFGNAYYVRKGYKNGKIIKVSKEDKLKIIKGDNHQIKNGKITFI